MITFLLITLVAALGAAGYLFLDKKASIQIGTFPGVLIGSSYSENTVTYTEKDSEEEKVKNLHTLQFSLVFIMITIIWVKQ